jgi:hypothetical protein
VVILPQFERALSKYPNYIVRALVPLRESTVIPYCLNWADEAQFRRLSFNTERGLADCEDRARKALVGNLRGAGKLGLRLKHTREFMAHYNAR